MDKLSTEGIDPNEAARPVASKPKIFRGCTPTSKVLHPISERCSVPSQQVGYSVHARD